MSEKDLDIAIEKCERIMEFDTRTLENPESENAWLFGRVYDLLKFLRRIQLETSERGDTIRSQADLITIIQNGIKATDADDVYSCGMRNGMRWCMSLIDGKEPLYENCPPAQPSVSKTEIVGDVISRKAAVELIERMKPYHQDADDIAEMIANMPPAQQWIPSKKLKPKDGEEVFVYLFDDSPYIAWVIDGRWYTEDFEVDEEDYPDAWMSLPAKYRPEGDETVCLK